MGYSRAGFEVVGVDVAPQPRYPFEFVRADALSILRGMADYPTFSGEMWRPGYFAAIHASPPCQDHTRTPGPRHGTGWMLAAARERLSSTGIPWVIENVPGAPMRADYLLCGCMFGLPIRRERWFETSWRGFGLNPAHDHREAALSVVGNGTPSGVLVKGIVQTADSCRAAMGIPWMTRKELSQAIPPAYTEHIGRALVEHLASGRAAC